MNAFNVFTKKEFDAKIHDFQCIFILISLPSGTKADPPGRTGFIYGKLRSYYIVSSVF